MNKLLVVLLSVMCLSACGDDYKYNCSTEQATRANESAQQCMINSGGTSRSCYFHAKQLFCKKERND
jgi:hypothetical protein